MTLRAAVIGARRRRQGTGAFIAAALERAGAQVVAVLGTRPESAAEASDALRASYAISAQPYSDLPTLLVKERPDVVAVCSPAEVHREQVLQAVRAGCHVFCEKPLWWTPGQTREQVASEAQALVDEFARQRRFLSLNTQWPHTVPSFRLLHPQAFTGPLTHLELLLGPMSRGSQMVVDSGSHLLSMLQVLAGPGVLRAVRVSREAETAHVPETLTVSCTYEHRAGALEASLRLVHSPEPPRPAGYTINGFSVHRTVELDPYRVSFVAEDRSVSVPDPTTTAVRGFLDDVRAGQELDSRAIVDGMTQLHELVTAAEHQ